MRLNLNIIILFIALTLSGCFRITYRVFTGSGDAQQVLHWNHYFVAGLIPVQEKYSFAELCPAGELIEVRSWQSPPNVLASLLGFLNSASSLEAVCVKQITHTAPAAPTERSLSDKFWR